jgi:hypothetical protein
VANVYAPLLVESKCQPIFRTCPQSLIPSILDRIRSAATPPRFTHEFLKSNLGFSSSNDRAVIKVLKQLGFLTSDGTPTPRYNDYRGPDGGRVLAEGLRDGWLRCF